MPYLLDTHTFIWWVSQKHKLPKNVIDITSDPDNEILVSIVTPWEIAIKTSLRKLPDPGPVETLLHRAKFESLPIEFSHIETLKTLPHNHRDPFDRLLIAQALNEKITLISNETFFDTYGVERIWD